MCGKGSGKGGGGGCQLIGTVLFNSLSLGKCQGFKYSTPEKERSHERKHHGGHGRMQVMTIGANKLME
jgi:hypothetical protein